MKDEMHVVEFDISQILELFVDFYFQDLHFQ